MNKKTIAKVIYYELIPVVIGFFLFGYLGRAANLTDFIYKMAIFVLYMAPFSIAYTLVGGFIFSRFFPPDTCAQKLMAKMVSCKIKKENGYGYCAKCPDNLACIKSIGCTNEIIDDTNEIDEIKGDVEK